MKIRIISLFFILFSLGCKNEDRLVFEPISFIQKKCDSCPTIEISIPNAMENSKINQVVNTALREEIISLLNFDEDIEAEDIESAIRSFQEGYVELKELYTEEATPWEAKIRGEVTYEDKIILTIRLDSYLFTGGAHGYSTSRFLNFDKQKGAELENSELFKNEEKFEAFAETEFRLQENIPEATPINSTGFMFETGDFYLPENIGYTKEGLQLFYEQYEVASYADGPIILTLPYVKINDHLVLPIKS